MKTTAAEGPVFVVGMQRSGTTLLRSVLSAHPQLTIAPETHYLNSFVDHSVDGRLSDRALLDALWEAFSCSTRFADLGLDAGEVYAAIEESGDFSYRRAFVEVLRAYARKMGKARWGEKTPSHQRYVHVLLDWFPDARVIFVVRDPRAVAASLVKVPWRNPEKKGGVSRRVEPTAVRRTRVAYHDGLTWQQNLDRFLNRWQDDDRVLMVRYEDLVSDPEGTARKLCSFVGEPFDPSMVHSRSRADVPPPAARVHAAGFDSWRREHIDKTLKPIDPSSLSRWEQELSTLEIDVIERVCERGMARLGYEPVTRQPGPARRLTGTLALQGCRLFWMLRRSTGPSSLPREFAGTGTV